MDAVDDRTTIQALIDQEKIKIGTDGVEWKAGNRRYSVRSMVVPAGNLPVGWFSCQIDREDRPLSRL